MLDLSEAVVGSIVVCIQTKELCLVLDIQEGVMKISTLNQGASNFHVGFVSHLLLEQEYSKHYKVVCK